MLAKTKEEIKLLREAGKIVFETHQHLKNHIKPGITTKELDKLAYDFIKSKDATPSFLGFEGFPASTCTSINDEVVHGIPSNRALKNGDIISIDIGANYKGYHGDSAWTYPVGNISTENQRLLEKTEEALFIGLSTIKDGSRVGDIGEAIESFAKINNLSVVRELVGHGVGTNLHEEPDVPNYGKKGSGALLKEGTVIAVEPMLNLGKRFVNILENDWTIVTNDSSCSAHFEHTILVTKDGYEILTKR